jgi:predicted nucleic acid-binding protein
VTVVDTSIVVDYLLDAGGPMPVLIRREPELTAPDVIVFETLAVLRRAVFRRELSASRAGRAVERLTALPLGLMPTLPLARRAWELRNNMTVADALFVALAERLGEPLVTKDASLAAAARTHTAVDVLVAG